MKSETEQSDVVIKLFQTVAELDPRPEFVKSLGAFITNREVWPRFRMAPASTAVRFHHAYDGGLLDHCVDVAELAIKADPDRVAQRSSILAVAFLHDLHKIGNAGGAPNFTPNMIKNGTVRSDKIPYISNESAVKFGMVQMMNELKARELNYLLSQDPAWPDGDLSLSLVSALDPALFALLTADEKFSIQHHAGMYDRQVRHLLGGNETYLQILMHAADMWSSRRNRWFGSDKEE